MQCQGSVHSSASVKFDLNEVNKDELKESLNVHVQTFSDYIRLIQSHKDGKIYSGRDRGRQHAAQVRALPRHFT